MHVTIQKLYDNSAYLYCSIHEFALKIIQGRKVAIGSDMHKIINKSQKSSVYHLEEEKRKKKKEKRKNKKEKKNTMWKIDCRRHGCWFP